MVPINYLAVLAAAIVSMAIGFFWYSQMAFGKAWMKEKGMDKMSQVEMKKKQKEMGPWYGLTFVTALVTAYVLAHIMFLSHNFFQYSEVQTGLSSAFWLWLGFIMPVQLSGQIFGDKNWKLLGIDTGYQLVSILAMGVVIGLM